MKNMINESKIRNKDGLTEEEFLSQYRPGDYERPSVTVDMLLFTVGDSKKANNYRKLPEKKLKILLIKRKDHPYINQWAIPGGFVNIDESVDEAVYRELKEETNIDNVYLEQLYTWGDVNRDPRMRVISVSYMALVPEEDLKPQAGDDALEVRWFTVEKEYLNQDHNDESKACYDLYLESDDEERISIHYYCKESVKKIGKSTIKDFKVSNIYSQNKLAFDHYQIINTAIDRLRNKLEYTPIAFNLMPETFTLTELQQVYETILNQELITPNFRRKICDLVEAVPEKRAGAGHRPAQLFKYKD